MKTWNELTPEQKDTIKANLESELIQDLCEIGPSMFSGQKNEEELKLAYDQAGRDAERMRTPWFFSAYLWDHACIRQFANDTIEYTVTAKETYFLESGENAIPIPA